MAVTSTLRQIVEQVADETDIGRVCTVTGTTTTLTDASGTFNSTSITGADVAIGSWILTTAGSSSPGQMTRVSNYVPSTGVITVNPAILTGVSSAIIFYRTEEMDKAVRVVDAVNRALNNRVTRWQRQPLTFVPDGDLQGATVTDFWTATAGTPTYVTPTFPALAAAAHFPASSFERVLNFVTTNATNALRSNLIDLALNATTQAYQWYFQTAIRVAAGSGNAQFLMWDETNNAQITVNVINGSDTQTHTTTSLGFLNISGTANIPPTCKQISFRLVSSATATTVQMAPLIAYPVNTLTFPIPNRIVAQTYIGNFHYARPLGGANGPYAVAFSEPITTGGRTHTINAVGDHFEVTFNFPPTLPVWFDELTYDEPLTLMTDTTTFPLDQVVKWTKFELFKMFYYGEKPRSISYASRVIPVPSIWKTRAREALKEAQGSDYEPPLMQIYGRT